MAVSEFGQASRPECGRAFDRMVTNKAQSLITHNKASSVSTNDFKDQVPLGKTGLMVGRLGIASSYGVQGAALEEAFEQGCNYFYWGSIRRPGFGAAVRSIASRAR